jgi:hypothetical protein
MNVLLHAAAAAPPCCGAVGAQLISLMGAVHGAGRGLAAWMAAVLGGGA